MGKYTFRLELSADQDIREVEADNFGEQGRWLIFYRNNPCGGPAFEYWRVAIEFVISMTTKKQ